MLPYSRKSSQVLPVIRGVENLTGENLSVVALSAPNSSVERIKTSLESNFTQSMDVHKNSG